LSSNNTNQSKCHHIGHRFNFRKTRISIIIGWLSTSKLICVSRHGMIPMVKTGFPDEGYLETSGLSIWVKQFGILITKLRKWD